jgi:hypothetical protein
MFVVTEADAAAIRVGQDYRRLDAAAAAAGEAVAKTAAVTAGALTRVSRPLIELSGISDDNLHPATFLGIILELH